MTDSDWDDISRLKRNDWFTEGTAAFPGDTEWRGIQIHAGDLEDYLESERRKSETWVEVHLSKPTFVSLSEALSWIAFRKLMNKDQLELVLSSPEGSDAEKQLADAMRQLSEQASVDNIGVRGRYVMNYSDPSAAAEVERKLLPKEPLRDFACFECRHGGLVRGVGLVSEGDTLEGRSDGWRDVVVCYDELLKAFQAPEAEVPTAKSDRETELGGTPNKMPCLPDAQLKRWWAELPDSDKDKPQAALHELCKAAHPENFISRQRVRDLVPGRKPGPRPNRP